MFAPTRVLLLCLACAVLLLTGLLNIYRGRWGKRRGTTPHCRRCDYALVGIDPDRCPECGTPLEPRNIVHGDRVRDRRLMAIGAVIFAVGLIGLGVLVPHASGLVDWYRFKPDAWVMADFRSGSPGVASRAWDELRRRDAAGGLSAARRDALVERALAEQAAARPSPLASPMVDWLGDLVVDGRVSDARRQRFYRQCVQVSLTVRPTVVLGDPIPYRFTAAGRAPIGGAWQYLVDEGRVTLDGATVEAGGGGSSGGSGFGGAGSTSSTVPCKTPGPHTVGVTARVRLFHGPSEPDVPVHQHEVTVTAATNVLAAEPPDYLKRLTDPALGERLRASIRAKGITRRGDGNVRFVLAVTSVPANVAFDVVARAGGAEYPVGTVVFPKGTTTELQSGHGGHRAPRVGSMDLVLRSNEKLARESVDLAELWAGEIVLKDVPVNDARRESK